MDRYRKGSIWFKYNLPASQIIWNGENNKTLAERGDKKYQNVF